MCLNRSAASSPPQRQSLSVQRQLDSASVSATSLSPIRASAPRSLAVDVVNSEERRAAPGNHQGVQFSVATNTGSISGAAQETIATSNSEKWGIIQIA